MIKRVSLLLAPTAKCSIMVINLALKTRRCGEVAADEDIMNE